MICHLLNVLKRLFQTSGCVVTSLQREVYIVNGFKNPLNIASVRLTSLPYTVSFYVVSKVRSPLVRLVILWICLNFSVVARFSNLSDAFDWPIFIAVFSRSASPTIWISQWARFVIDHSPKIRIKSTIIKLTLEQSRSTIACTYIRCSRTFDGNIFLRQKDTRISEWQAYRLGHLEYVYVKE